MAKQAPSLEKRQIGSNIVVICVWPVFNQIEASTIAHEVKVDDTMQKFVMEP